MTKLPAHFRRLRDQAKWTNGPNYMAGYCAGYDAAIADMLTEVVGPLRELISIRHYTCEDNWYSCPMSDEGCPDETQKECNCGVDEKIKALAEIEGKLK